jgi:hypothetical protein
MEKIHFPMGEQFYWHWWDWPDLCMEWPNTRPVLTSTTTARLLEWINLFRGKNFAATIGE